MVCHGAAGGGNGPAAGTLSPRPRDFADAAWQALVTDEQLRLVIVRGGVAVGKSRTMPANIDLDGQPELVADLVELVRSFAARPSVP